MVFIKRAMLKIRPDESKIILFDGKTNLHQLPSYIGKSTNMNEVTGNQTELLIRKDFSSYLELYEEHNENLIIYAFLVLGDETRAKIAVRAAFVKLWQHPDKFLKGRTAYSVLFSEVKVMAYLLKST